MRHLLCRNVARYEAGKQEILIHQFEDPNLEKFQYYDLLKSFCIAADLWIKDQKFLAEGHIIILDLNNYSLRMITKVNIFYFREFLIYLLVRFTSCSFHFYLQEITYERRTQFLQ